MSRIDTNFVKQLYSQAGVELTPEKLDHISNNYSSNEELQSAFELKYGSMNASTPEKKNSDVTSTSTSEAPQSESQQPPKKTSSLSVGGKPKKTGASASSAGGGKKVGGKEVKKESPFGPPIQTFQEQKTQEFKEVKKKEEAKKKEVTSKKDTYNSKEFEYKPVFDERGRQVKIKNEKGEIVPYMEKVPKGFASSTEEREIKIEEQKQKALKPIISSSNLKKYQDATKVSEEEITSLQKEIDDEFNQKGFWNGITSGAKKGFNFLADTFTTIGTFGTETEASDNFKLETDSFAKEKKQAEEELKSSNQPLTEELINQRAKEIRLDKKIEGLVADKNNKFLSELPEDEVKALNLEKVRQYKTLSDKDKYLITKSKLVEIDLEKETKDFLVALAIIEKNKKEGKQTSQELLDFVAKKQENGIRILSEVESLENEILTNKENIGSTEEEIDYLKRNYDTADKVKTLVKLGFGDLWNSVANKMPLMISDLDRAIFEPLRPGSSENILSDDERQKLIDESIDWETAKELAKSKVKKDVEFENLNLDNFGQFFTQELSNQVRNFAQMALPGGVISIGMTSAFDKYGSMEQESNNIVFDFDGKSISGFEKEDGQIVDSLGNTYKPDDVKITSIRESDKSTANKFFTSVTFGTAEALLGAMPTKNIFSRAIKSMSNSGKRTLFRKSIKEYVKSKGSKSLDDAITESASEGATQLIQNIADVFSGKKDVNIYDGIGHASFSGGMLGFLMSQVPAAAGIALKPFSKNKERIQVRKNLSDIFTLQAELNNSELSDASRNVIEAKISKLEQLNSDILSNVSNRTKGMSEEVFEAIKSINKKQEILKIQASEIKKDKSLDDEIKKRLITDLESEFNNLEEKRDKLTSDEVTVLDVLPDSESVKLKIQAAEAIIQEQLDKGVERDNIQEPNPEVINKKAIEIYESNKQTTGQVSEQEKPTTTTETETTDATQQETELQSQEKVSTTPKTETDAVQKQITDEGVLQPEQSKMGLQEMEQGDKINQVVAEQSQEKVIPKASDPYTSNEVERVKALPKESEDGATMNLDGSKYEGGGLVIPLASKNMDASELTPEAIQEFINENAESIGEDNVKVGIYKFPNSNQVSIDISIVADPSMREEGIAIGKELGQESLFDLDTFENVKTGADGMNPKKLSPSEFRDIQQRLKPKNKGVEVSKDTNEAKKQLSKVENKKVAKAIINGVKAISKLLPNVKVIIHDTDDSFRSVSGESKNQESSGLYKNGEIHINLPKANVRTVAHEIFHAILLDKVKTDSKAADVTKKMIEALAPMLDKNKALKQRLQDFADNYDDNIQNEEKIAELVGILASNFDSLSGRAKEAIKNWLNSLAKMFGVEAFESNEVLDVLNTIAKSVATGKEMSGKDIDILNEIELVYSESNGESGSVISASIIDRKQFDDSIDKTFNTSIEYDDTNLPDKIKMPSKSTINNVLDKSGGAAVFINSDGTKVGVRRNGDPLQGGWRYTYLVENQDSNIGFAATSTSHVGTMHKISSSLAELRDSNNPSSKGKPIAVFITIQNADTMLGEWYAGEFFMEGIDEAITKGKFKGGLKAARKLVLDALTSKPQIKELKNKISELKSQRESVIDKAGIDDKISKLEAQIKNKEKSYNDPNNKKLISLIKSEKFDTHEGRIDISRELASKDFSFGYRVGLLKQLIPLKAATGANREIKKALLEVNYGRREFYDNHMDEILLDKLKSTNYEESSIGGITMGGFYLDPYVSYDNFMNNRVNGVDHAQFNESFSSNGETFLLDNALNVNKLSPEMGYPTNKGYELYNKKNNTSFDKKNTSLSDRLKIAEFLSKETNNNSEYLTAPFTSIGGSMYTSIIKPTSSDKISNDNATRQQKVKEENEYQRIAKVKLDKKEFNAIRASLRNTLPDSLTLEVLDAVAKGETLGYDYDMDLAIEDMIENGVSFNNIANILMQDEDFVDKKNITSKRRAIDYLIRVGDKGTLFKAAYRQQKSLPENVSKKLTETPEGKVVFKHFSDERRDVIKKGQGTNRITSREEASALGAVGGLAMFYTMEGQVEAGVGNVEHTVLVSKDKVYDIDSDPLGFEKEARKRFNEVRPGQAFTNNHRGAFITQVANENGFDVAVTQWRGSELRAQSTKELTPSEKSVEFKERPLDTFNEGDYAIIDGRESLITNVDGNKLRYESLDGVAKGTTINNERNRRNIVKIDKPSVRMQKPSKQSSKEKRQELSDAKKEIQNIFSAAKEALKIQKDRNKVIDGLKKDVNKFIKSAIQDLEAGDIGKRAISSIISKVQSVTDQNFEEKLLEVNDILDNLYTNRDVNKAKADSKNAYSNVMSGKVGKLDKEGDMDKVMSSKVVGLTMLDPNTLKKVLSDVDFSQYKDYINRLAERSLAIKETDLKAINDLYDRIISPYTDHVVEVNRIQQIIDAGGTLSSAESKFVEDNKSEFSERETPESIAEKEAKKADRDAKKQAEIAEKKRKIKELLPSISDVFASSIAEKGSIEWDILENLSNLTDEDIESMPENMLNNVFNALNSMVYNDVLVSYANEIHKYKLKQDHKKTFTETLSKSGKKGIYKAKLIKPLLKIREVIGLPISAIWKGIDNKNLKQEIIDRRIKFFNFSSIDAAVKVYGETPIFNNIMSRFGKAMARVSSAEEKAETILLKVKKDLDKKSKNPQESYMKIVYHLIDAMAKNNVGNKSEVSAMEYFEATLSDPNSKIAENNRAKELIQAFVNKVKANNNEIEELTKEELNAVNAIRKVLDDNKINAYEANFFQNSNASPMINAYYPVMNSLKNQAEQDLVKLKNRFGISNVVSIKSGNLEEKTGTAHPIDMNPFSTAFSSIKSTIFQHQLRTEYQALKQALSELEIENTNNKEVLSYLSGIKKAVDSQFELLTNGVVGTEQTLADDVLNAMDKSFYTLALGSVISRGVDFLGNMVQLATISPKILANNRRVLNNLLAIKKDDESGTEILRNFYKNAEASDINKMISSKKISTERTEFMNRGANRGVLSKGLPSSNLVTKIKARITDPITSATSGAVDLLLGFGDVKPYGMSWNGVFYEEFKKQAGVEVDVEKIARGDVEYLKRYKDAIKKASNKANQENADLYGSTNPMEKKVGIMEIAKKPVKSSLAGAIGALRNKAAYLFSSFDMNARNAINTSINTYIENQDSREARKLIGGAVRLAMYSASISYTTSALWNAFKGDDDDEDELKKSFDKLSNDDDFIKYVNSSLLDFPIQKDAEGNIIQLNIDDLARYNEMRDKLMSNKEFAKAYDIMYGYLNRDLFDIQVRSKVNQINQGNYEYDRSVVDGFFTDIDNGFGKSGEDIIEVLGILNSEQGYKMFTQEEIDENILKVEEYMSRIDFLNNRAIRESGGAIDRLLITKVASTLSDYRTDASLEDTSVTEGLKLLMGMMFSRSNNFGKAAANYSAEFANKLITESKRGERGYDVYKDGIFQSPVKYKLKEDASLIDDAVNVLFPVFQKFDKYRYSDYSLPDLIRFTPMGILGVNDLAKINSKMKNDVIYQETNGKYKENILKDISKTKIDILRDKKKVEQDRLDEQFKKSRVIPGVKETKLKSRFPSYNENKDLKVNGRSAN